MGNLDVFDIYFDNLNNDNYREGDNISGYLRIVNAEEIKYKGYSKNLLLFLKIFYELDCLKEQIKY